MLMTESTLSLAERRAPQVERLVARRWPGSVIVCIGGGPSLTLADTSHVGRSRVRAVAINDAYRLLPGADVLYACDAKWWQWHDGVPEFHGRCYALESGASRWGVSILQQAGERGLEDWPGGLRTGRNSGYQAINLAYHLGASRIALLGYDCRHIRGKKHFFGNHTGKNMNNAELSVSLSLSLMISFA